jgi:polysaccharide export outer membrane protein
MKKIMLIMLCVFSTSVFAADNVLNDGDLVRMSVYGNPDLTTELKVTASGELNVPLIGQIMVKGLSATQAEQAISKKLIKDGYLKQAQVNLVVLQSVGQQVSILGQVAKPGKYSIETGAKTLFDFIALSGGVSANGSDFITVVRVSENPAQRMTFNLRELLLQANANQINSANVLMRADDIIYVPEAPVFYVYGEAKTPGVFRHKPRMTLLQALSMAGGLSNRGTENGLTIQRRNPEGQLLDVTATMSTEILEDDIVTIKESLF